ncbi:MAG TPA: hypothetical protein VD866_26320 [Urbifossiella sp.]|nr:hypothetical protein [Urbifossiella sp.]
MVKLFAILAASAAVAGGATFAVFHHIDPNHCPLSGCEVAKPACCALPPAEAASPTEPAACTESPVSADAPCCAKAGRACCAPASATTALTAAVGPAAAVR